MMKLLTGLTVLLVHTAAAYAQQSPPPEPASPPPQAAPQEYPPGYGPPPGYAGPGGYGAPPPAPPQYGTPQYGAQPPPPQYYYVPPQGPPPPPPRRVTDRPFTIGGGIGFGRLVFPDPVSGRATSSEGGFSYTARLGFGLGSRLILMWDIEGAVVNHNAENVAQTAHLAALQLFLTNRLFAKGGFGLAQFSERNGGSDFFSTWGGALMGGIGYELVQGWNWSFDVEGTATGARYTGGPVDQTWTNWGLNFAINFF